MLKRSGKGLAQDLFARLNGLTAEQYYEPYSHQGNWLNRLIRGESSQVMASLLEHEGMAGTVQMVYFDPPYGIGFDSNFQSLTGKRKARKGAQSDVETTKQFRDRYRDGLHSYMDALHRNLTAVRELLTDGGSVFVQIGADNMYETGMVVQHVFGKNNRLGTITYKSRNPLGQKGLPEGTTFIVWFAKDKEKALEHYNQLYTNEISAEGEEGEFAGKEEDSRTRPNTHLRAMSSIGHRKGRDYDFTWENRTYKPKAGRSWPISKDGMDRLAELGRLVGGKSQLCLELKEDEVMPTRVENLWADLMRPSDPHYVVETAESVVERCLLMTTKPGDLVMDITCGSGTTAFVAEKWGRRWITTDTAAVPIALARQRLATAVHPYQILQDSPEGAEQERILGGKPLEKHSGRNPSNGFVYERRKRVTPKTLAYDEEPETVLMVDKPILDKTKLRVSAPFCVQNANATAWLPISDRYDDPRTNIGEAQLTLERIENALITAGIKYSNGTTGKRIQVQNLRSFGERIELSDEGDVDGVNRGYITHTADVIMPDDNPNPKAERAAIVIVGFHRRVASTFTNHAVMEANEMPGVKHLIVIGFEFESAAQRGRKKRGQLNVVQVQANTDLAIETLEDSASDDAFVMLGEPELKITKGKNNKYTVEVVGFMTYDPETGSLRSAGPEDIHCWLLDSDYDRKSFMCRELHFMNARDKQLERLQGALGALLDSSAWATMIGTTSREFDEPTNDEHLIAVRIVTTTGVELTTIRDVTAKA